MAQLVKNPPAMRETWVPFLGREDSLEKGETTHSSILAWRIPWTSPWGCKESDMTEQLSLHFIKSINNSDYSYTQTGEDTMGQRPSGRWASPPHPPLGFSPAPSRSMSTGTPLHLHRPLLPCLEGLSAPHLPRDATEPFTGDLRTRDREEQRGWNLIKQG